MRAHRSWTTTAACIAISVAGAAVAAPLTGQAARSPTAGDGWVFVSSPQVDAWFHALAVIDPRTPGRLPMYAPDYAERIRKERPEPGALARDAAGWRAELARDSAYEVLHFLPLYFTSATREGMLEALGTIGGGGEAADVRDAAARFGASVAEYVLDAGRQREVLTRLVQAVETEWVDFYDAYRMRRVGSEAERLRTLQQVWTSRLEPALRPYLAAHGLGSGIVIVSEPLGPEGRLFAGDPATDEDNLVAIRLTDGSRGDRELYYAVREMAFPMVRALDPPAAESRMAAESWSQLAAVRAGALLLERYAPEHAYAYMATFLDRDVAAAEREAAFRRAFPIDAGTEAGLRGVADRLPGG